MRTWVDASAIIALDAIGELDFLRDVLGEVYITEEIAKEVSTDRASSHLRGAVGTWIRIERVRGNARPFRAVGLGHGEASLFLTPEEDLLVIDEVPARRVAEAEGRARVGLLGLILQGARTRIISRPRARDIVERLVASGFRTTVGLHERIRAELADDEGNEGKEV